MAHLIWPVLAVHISDVEPMPHQTTAVCESMLPRLPLRFLSADDAGARKTIIAGVLIKETIGRVDVQRRLAVCPGSLPEQLQNKLSHRFQLRFVREPDFGAVSVNYDFAELLSRAEVPS